MRKLLWTLLVDLMPGAGHLVHMPSHIYWRVGRYRDASEANYKPAAIDQAYISAVIFSVFMPLLYYPHNLHFLWAAYSMEGRSRGGHRGGLEGSCQCFIGNDRALSGG